MTNQLALPTVIEQIKAIVEERPDWVDPGTVYDEAGLKPGCSYSGGTTGHRCIVGEWLSRYHAVSDEHMEHYLEGLSAKDVVVEVLDLDDDDLITDFLEYIQNEQDCGVAWSEAFNQACLDVGIIP